MYEHITYGLRGKRDPQLRIGDAEREATAERLRRSHADGRLDVEEFQERIDRCYQAKTVGELDQLVTDLPPEEGAEQRSHRVRVWRIPLVPILIAILLISVASGFHGHFALWIVIPLFLLARMWRYGPMMRRRRPDEL